MTSSEERKTCGREFCDFSAPLKDWKKKKNGEPNKWCEHCLDIAAAKTARVKARKEAAGEVCSKTRPCTGETKARREEKERVDALSLVKCADCGEEMVPRNMKTHRMYNCTEREPD